MTVTIAECQRSIRRSRSRAISAGFLAGLLAAFGGAHAAPPPQAQPAPVHSLDPSRQLPGSISVSSIDFNRGDNGVGRLTIGFSGDGATVDLQDRGGTLIVEMPNASLPARLAKPMDLADFQTPVDKLSPVAIGVGSSRLILDIDGTYKPVAFQSGNKYVLEVAPSSGPKASGSPSTSSRAVAAKPKYSGSPVTFNFQDVPVRTVLQVLAEEAKVNLVVSDSVGGNITLRLVNVPWDQALDVVLRARELDKRRDGNVLWVAPQKELAAYELAVNQARIASENSGEMITAYLPANYANAKDLVDLLTGKAGENNQASGGSTGNIAGTVVQRGLLSMRGSVSADERTNTLIVHDTSERVEDIKKFLTIIDRPVDQVVIEARIVIANESFARELGARFGVSGASGKDGDRSTVGYGGSLESSQANAQARADAIDKLTGAPGEDQSPPFNVTRGLITNLPGSLLGGGALALSILNAGQLLDVELSAMQTEGRGEIISNPRIVTSNQKEAVIKQGDQIGYLTTTGGQQGNLPSVQFKDAILQLKVTPTITADGRVFLNMDVQKDDLSGFVETGAGQVPQISTRQVTTSVLVDDGQTVVIGGVYEFKDQQSLSKVPFLADLPVLGNLFKKRGRTKSKAELLIMVTPKVIRVAQRPAG